METQEKMGGFVRVGGATGLILLGLLGCSNQVASDRVNANTNANMPGANGSGGSPNGSTPSSGGGPAAIPTVPGTPPVPGVCTALGGIGQRVWRLSNRQYSNSVRDVLKVAMGPAVNGGGASEFAFFSGDLERVDDGLAYSYWQAAEASAASVSANASFAGCQPGEAEATCTERFATTFASRAFRRPVSTEETTQLLQAFAVGRAHSFNRGIELMTKAVLQAPSFVYRTELGSAGPSAETTLTPFETASQLSYLLFDSIPDEALIAAAQSGALATPAGLGAEFDRLSQLPEAQANMTRIVEEWFGTRRAGAASKDAVLFPEWDAALKADLIESTRLFIQETLWSGARPLEDLATSQRVFVNQRLGSFYGLDAAGLTDQFVGVDFPGNQRRAGLLTYPAMLAAVSNVSTTSVVHRGLYVRKEVICAEPIPPPPDGLLADPALQQALSMLPTERAAADYRVGNAACGGCHALIDPYGLLFEHFDPVGRYRDTADGQAIDSSATLALSATLNGRIDGAVALGQGIAQDGVFSTCAVRKLTSYALGRTVPGNTCEVNTAHTAYQSSDRSIRSLLREIVLSKFMQTRGGVL